MKVLSLFDGISCARVALERAGIPVEVYYASEVDKYAIQIAQKNYPDTLQVGDIKNLQGHLITKIDLLIGGSPCQDLSIAKKDRKGLNGERSGLFYEYVRILKEVKPKYFILENVASMPKEAKETITQELFGIEPVMINASLVSAQNRKRLFWVSSRLDLCYNCKYEQLLKEIQYRGKTSKTQTTSVGELLSEKPKEENKVQDLQKGILPQDINSEMLLRRVYEYQQKAERQESNSKKERLPKEILREKKERIARIWKELSVEQQREFSEILQKIHFQARGKNEKSTEGSVEEKQKDHKYDWERGIVGYVEKDKHGVCFLQFYGGLDGRPYNPSEQGWNERFGELATPMSELQFIQERQTNHCSCCGGVFPVKYIQVDVPQPEDKGILLKDILEEDVDEKYYIKTNFIKIPNPKGNRIGIIGKGGQGDRVYGKFHQSNSVYTTSDKSVTLSANGGGRGAKTGLYAVSQRGRHLVDGKRKDVLGAKTEQRIEIGSSEKAHTITSVFKDSMIMEGMQIRKLTPIECERLQCLPDNYTEGVSNTQRYKALGNAFNVDVVSHILKFIK